MQMADTKEQVQAAWRVTGAEDHQPDAEMHVGWRKRKRKRGLDMK